MTTDEIIRIRKAWEAKKAIQCRHVFRDSLGNRYSDWLDFVGEPLNFESFEWREKPQPEPKKPREWWFNVYFNAVETYRYRTQAEADKAAGKDRVECVHVVEVL